MQNSVSLPTLDPRAVSGTTEGAIDMFDCVDAVRGLFVRIAPSRIPRGAPVLVAGFAVDPTCDLPPAAVAVVLDHTIVHAAEAGLSRYDVKALLGPQTPEMIGFRALIPTDRMAPGDHALITYALGADGRWYEAGGRTFTLYARMLPELPVAPRRMRVEIDVVRAALPGEGRGTIPGVVPFGQFALLCGWAADRDTLAAPAGVCAIDDRGGRWTAPCDLSRPDVRSALGAGNDRFGFEIPIPTDGLGRGLHTADVWAFDGGGRRLGRPCPISFEVVMPLRPFPAFAEPLPTAACSQVLVRVRGRSARGALTLLSPERSLVVARGDVLEFEGWAALPDGEPAAQVVIEMQPRGVPVPPARYHPIGGYRRKKPPRDFTPPPHEDAWFSYELDTQLSSGIYCLSLAVVAGGGYRFARADLGTVSVLETEG